MLVIVGGYVLLLMITVHLVYYIRSSGIFYLPVFLIIAAFCILNLQKEVEGDYIWYSSHYLSMAKGKLLILFTEPLEGVQAKYREPLYHLFSYLLAKLSNGNISLHIIATTVFIYGFYALAINNIAKSVGLGAHLSLLVVVWGLLSCVTFTQTNNLIRQYMASGVCLFFIASIMNRTLSWRQIVFALISILLHNSMLIPVFISIIIHFILYNSCRFKIIILLFFAFLILTLGGLALYILSMFHHGIYTKNDGSISGFLIFYDVILLGVSCFFVSYFWHLRGSHVYDSLRFLYFVFLFYCLFLVSIIESPLLFLRFYFFIDFLRVIPFVIAVRFCLTYSLGSFCSSFVVLLGALFLILRLYVSPFNFGF